MMTEKVGTKKEEPNRALTSPVWIYFKTCEDNPVMANCSLCGIRMSRGGITANRCGTTNLRRHLLTAHKITLPSSKKKNTGKNNFRLLIKYCRLNLLDTSLLTNVYINKQ